MDTFVGGCSIPAHILLTSDWVLFVYCTHLGKRIVDIASFSELLLHYFITVNPSLLNFQFPMLTAKPPLPGAISDET